MSVLASGLAMGATLPVRTRPDAEASRSIRAGIIFLLTSSGRPGPAEHRTRTAGTGQEVFLLRPERSVLGISA